MLGFGMAFIRFLKVLKIIFMQIFYCAYYND